MCELYSMFSQIRSQMHIVHIKLDVQIRPVITGPVTFILLARGHTHTRTHTNKYTHKHTQTNTHVLTQHIQHTRSCFSLTPAINFLELRGTLVLISKISNVASLHMRA